MKREKGFTLIELLLSLFLFSLILLAVVSLSMQFYNSSHQSLSSIETKEAVRAFNELVWSASAHNNIINIHHVDLEKVKALIEQYYPVSVQYTVINNCQYSLSATSFDITVSSTNLLKGCL